MTLQQNEGLIFVPSAQTQVLPLRFLHKKQARARDPAGNVNETMF